MKTMWRSGLAVAGRFTTPDPLAEDYYSLSPYAYCAGNPVNFVDPEGLDIWGVDPRGFLHWLNVSENNILYALDYLGNKGAYMEFEDLRIVEALSSGGIFDMYTSTSGINEMFKMFKFFADNTEVEWVIHRVGREYTIGTKHDKNSSGLYSDYGISFPNASLHSHPEGSDDYSSMKNELESMGYAFDMNGELVPPYGDWSNSIDDGNRHNGKLTRMSYVYFPDSHNLYYVGYWRPIFIRNIRNDYRRFFFGTLNLR